jgi:hypothetical protein
VSTAHSLERANAYLEAIDNARQETLRRTFEFLESTHLLFQSSKACSFKCDAMHLGALMIGLGKLRYSKLPEPPFNGISPKNLFDDLRALDLPQYCYEQYCFDVKKRKYISYDKTFCKGFKPVLTEKTAELKEAIRPVRLEWKLHKFKPGQEVQTLKVLHD